MPVHFVVKINGKFGLTCTEDVATAITSCSEVFIVAVRTEKFFILGGEGLVDQGGLTTGALKAVLMPMLVLVGEILQAKRKENI